MKDINDSSDGTESRVKIELTDKWKIYEIETKQFITADMDKIMIPLLFIFQSPIDKKINVRSIQFE